MTGREIDDDYKKSSGAENKPDDSQKDEVEEEKLTPEQEAAALQESQSVKSEANALFTSNDLHNAVSKYEDALLPLPRTARFHRAVLHSNISACHLKLEQHKEAVSSATAALDELTALEAAMEDTEAKKGDDVEGEIISGGAEKSEPAEGDVKADISRIRTKSLLRRARAYANTSPSTWHALSSAQSDYQTLSSLPPASLTQADARTVRTMLRNLEPRVKEAQEKEMGEMWGKLRELGDGLLRPFGLSTNNFQMVKDENTGGYSMNFKQDPGESQ